MIGITKVTNITNTTSCNRTPQWIVLHYTAGTKSTTGNARSTAIMFSKVTTNASADFIVDDGSIVQYNPDPKKHYTWAVGGTKLSSVSTSQGGKYYNIVKNSNSISIEMCSSKKNKASVKATDPDWYFTDATIKNTIDLVRHLMVLYNIDINHIVMHHHVTGKICPSPFCVNEAALSNWVAFINKLKGSSVSTPNIQVDNLKPNTTLSCTSTIKGVQEYLNKYYGTYIEKIIGAKLSIDGSFGSKSLKAVAIAFQKELNAVGATLTIDGSFGPSSEQAFNKYVGNLKSSSKGIFVTLWQCLLTGFGYSCNGIDGSFGTGCKNATDKLCIAKGLPRDYVVNGSDLNKLL